MAPLVETIRAGGLTLVAFPPSAFGLYLAPHATQSGHTVPGRAAEALAADPRLVAALDGPMFGLCGGGGYPTATCADLDYLHYDPDAGINDPGEDPTKGVTIGADRLLGRALVATGGRVPPGARVAVQLYPALVRQGQIVTSATVNPDHVWRAGLAILADGRLAFATLIGSMDEFARALVAAGAREAGYTDGGGSTRLEIAGEGFVGDRENRRVASFLVVRRPAELTATRIALGSLGVVATAAAVYGIVRLWRRPDTSGRPARG